MEDFGNPFGEDKDIQNLTAALVETCRAQTHEMDMARDSGRSHLAEGYRIIYSSHIFSLCTSLMGLTASCAGVHGDEAYSVLERFVAENFGEDFGPAMKEIIDEMRRQLALMTEAVN